MGRMTEEDRSLIFNLRVHKSCGSWRMMKEFPLKIWNRRTVDNITELSVGQLSSIQPNPTHKIADPTQPNP